MPYDDSSFEQLEPWEQDVATLAFGVDALLGEDPLHESGTRHFVVDSWTSGLDAPKLYNSNFADHMRKTGGIHGKQDPVAIASFIRLHELESLAERAVDGLPTSMDEDRRTFVRNISGALGAMLKTTMAMGKIPGAEMPSYEERYLAATPTETSVRLVDAAPYRERLQEALAVVGFNVTASRDLRKTYLAWEASQGEIPSEQVAEQVAETNAMLLGMTRAKFFDKWGVQLTAHAPNLSDVAFDGSEFRTLASARFTGSSIYRGGQLEDGRPALRQLYEYNLSHPLNPLSLLLLCAHEMVPGHYIHQAVTDLQWRDNKLGFEATMGTMCSPQVALMEGWAQNALAALYGSEDAVVEEYGPHMAVALAQDHLQDVAKHNVSILAQRDGKNLDAVTEYAANGCVLPDALVKKMQGVWSQHPIFMMYSPSYYVGAKVVREALETHGPLETMRLAYHTQGFADLKTFQDKLNRL